MTETLLSALLIGLTGASFLYLAQQIGRRLIDWRESRKKVEDLEPDVAPPPPGTLTFNLDVIHLVDENGDVTAYRMDSGMPLAKLDLSTGEWRSVN